MLTFVNIAYLLISGILIFILNKVLTKKHIPKGLKELPTIKGWPLVGVLFSFQKPLYAYLFSLKLKHGSIFKFRMGCRDIIVFNTSSVMKKTLKELGNNYSGRWKNIIVQTVIHDSGIINKDKEWWAIQRSFVLKVLKDFGLGKKRSQEIVDNECSILIKEVEESCGKVTNTSLLFPKFMVNVIAKLVMNMRFERSDPDFLNITKIVENVVHNQNSAVTLLLMYPVLEKFQLLSKMLLWLCGRDQEMTEIHDYIRKIINEHKKRFNPENEGEDLIDIFLKEKYKLDTSGEKNHTFTDWQLIRVGLELFIAGYETTSTTLSWSMLFLAKHQDIQKKVHEEIIDVVGSSRMLTLNDKKSLPYTQAVMDEIFRLSSVVPLSLSHRVFEDTDVDGYFIPKNSIIFPNIFAVHHDKDTWERPSEFYPEHFLTEINGQYKYTARDDLMPFSIGKRQCLGESLARLEFFTFLTSILQRFSVKFPKEINDVEYNRITVGTDGTIRAPLYTKVIFEQWQQ